MTNREMTCAAIQDLSGAGKCSLTVALPVLSVCGVETSVLPTAVLSTHTGGFTDVVNHDMTDEMLPIAERWAREGFRFSALYSGFLGSAKQIDIVERIFDMLKREDTLIMVDPVMGDGGRLYRTYTEEMANGMARLCAKADIIVPNMTEAARLLGTEYREIPHDKQEIEDILRGLCAIGAKRAVLTGVSFDGEAVGCASYDSEAGEYSFCFLPRIEGSFHGTGDLFASALLGGLLNGKALSEACLLATEFTHRCIKTTAERAADRRFGAKFEEHLPWLGAELKVYRKA